MAAPSESSRLLVQRIRLPENAHVYYTQFTSSLEDPYPSLDAVRRSLVSPEPLQPILDCLFPRIHISKDGPQLMVFCLGSQVSLTAPNKLKALSPAGLDKGISRVFDVSALYQKQPCGHSHPPCLTCSSATFAPLPRKDSRTVYRIFLDAVRDHILHRLSASQSEKREGWPVRLGRGFVLLPRRIEDSWATPWEQYVRSYGLLHLEIHIHLTAMDLIVQLNPQRLPSSPPLFACPVGTSLLLMPHSTPAYYLGTYAGSTTSSFVEFEENTVGWGIPRCLITETFILCWVPLRRLQERQDGGAIVLWPKELSLVNPSSPKLSFTPSIPFPTKPESRPSTLHQFNTPQPESSLSAGNSETLDLPSMATAMGEYIDSIIKERQRRPDLPNTSRNPIEVSPTHSNFPSSALIGAQGDFATPAIIYPSPPDQNLADLLRAIPVSTMMQTPSMEPSASLPEPQLPPEPEPAPEPRDHPMGSWDPFFTGAGNINDGIDSTMFDNINATGVDGLNGLSKVWNDDDFNFFDAPATISDAIIVDAPATSGRDIDFGISTIDWTNGMLTAGAPTTTPTFQAHGTATGGVTFQLPGVGQRSPTPNTNAELSSPHHHATVTPSPGKTPFSVLHEIEIPSVMQVDAEPDSDMFSRIEFVDSKTFDEADDKYLWGKFSLPSPPSDFRVDARVHHLQNQQEEDKRKSGEIPWDSGLVRGGDIRMRYIDATNPRLGILHAISGGQVKSTRMLKEKPAGRKLQWKEDDEPWRLATPPTEAESEISDESSGDEICVSETEAVSPGFQGQAAAPTATTTTTGSIPEGSRFLQARFDFSYIVKKGLAVVYDPATALTSAAPTMSVPTPVSPNTVAGGGDVHGSVSSQIAGRVATEAAENGLWAASIRAWGSTGKRQEGLAQFECRVLEKMVVEAMGVPLINLQEYVGVDASTATTPASAPTPKAKSRSRKGSIFSDTPPPVIEAAPEPKFYIGSGANVIQALPSILRFWNKLDVTPLSGTKDLCAIAVVPSDNPSSNSRSRTVGAWMQRLTNAYTARRFGSHSTTDMIQCGWGDIAPSCLGAISRYGGFPTIVYLILPKAFVEYSTPIAQQVFTAVNELLTQSHITVHLVPDVLVYHSEALASHPVVGADRIVLNVYDRLGRRVEREHARLSTSYQSQLVVQGHAFTLARSRPLKVLYQDQWPPPSQLLFDRHTFLHVAYGWSKDREWVVASLVTERGDDQDRFVGSGGEDLSSGDLVDMVWSFVEQFAKKVDVEWRVVICRLGLIPEEELEAWGHLLAIKMEEAHLPPLHVSLVSFTLGDAPTFATAPLLPALPVPPPVPLTRGSASKDSAVFVDSTSSTYCIYPQLLGVFPTLSDNLTKSEWITATSTEDDASWGLPVIPIATAWLLRVTRLPDWSVANGDQVSPRYAVRSCQIHMHQLWKAPGCTYVEDTDPLLREITTNFHELQVLERERRGSDVWLPHHLAGVDCMIQALDSISPSRSS